MPKQLVLFCLFILPFNINSQSTKDSSDLNSYFKTVKWRCIGPFRGCRSNCATGVVGNPGTIQLM